MIILDDILLFPVRGILWTLRELHNAAQQELAGEAEAITARLSELYMMLETGQISDEEFDAGEQELLDRLDEFQESGVFIEDEEDEEDFEEEDLEAVELDWEDLECEEENFDVVELGWEGEDEEGADGAAKDDNDESGLT